MDALDVTRALLRRWYAVLPLLAATALGVVLAGQRVQPEYHARASMLMLGPGHPQDATADGGVNPYRTAGLGTTTQALVQVVDSPAARQIIAAQSFDPGYVIKSGERTPIIEIKVASDSEDKAVGTARAVERLLVSELKRRQDAVRAPRHQRLSLGELAVPTTAFEEVPGLKRVRVVALGLGLLLTLVVGLGLDGLLLRRSRRRRSRRAAGPVHAQEVPSQVRGEGRDGDADPVPAGAGPGGAADVPLHAPPFPGPAPDEARQPQPQPRPAAGVAAEQEQGAVPGHAAVPTPDPGPSVVPAPAGNQPAPPPLPVPLGGLPQQAVASP